MKSFMVALALFAVGVFLSIALAKKAIGTEYSLHLDSASDASVNINDMTQVEKIDRKTFPVVLLYHTFKASRLQSVSEISPQFYIALWDDGKIIWGKLEPSRDNDIIASQFALSSDDVNSVTYLQSQISAEKVEAFFSAINDIAFWQYSKKSIVFPDTSSCCLFIQKDNQLLTITVPGIAWPLYPFKASIRAGDETFAEAWQRIANLILELIPEQGEKVDITIKRVIIKGEGIFYFPEAVKAGSKPDIGQEGARE
jgi:hypothetical protein